MEVSRQVVGFRKRNFYSTEKRDESLGETGLRLPPRAFPTAAVWFDLPSHKRVASGLLRRHSCGSGNLSTRIYSLGRQRE